MRIVKCDVCHKEFDIGYAVHVKPVAYAMSDSANVYAVPFDRFSEAQYDVCLDCMKGMLKHE